jgi:hypothetical protein
MSKPESDERPSIGSDTVTMARPLVSICVSAYNVERYIEETLRSILGQTYPKLELIVLDNGSTDTTRQILDRFSDANLKQLNVDVNLGGYEGMNKTIAEASGEFIAVFHSDDLYEPEIVEREVNYLMSHPEAAAVFCMDHFMDDDGRIYGGNSLPAKFESQDTFDYSDLFPDILRNKNARLCCPTFMVRKSVLDHLGSFDPANNGIGSDLEMWLRILRHYSIGILNERLIRYRHGRNNWSSRYNRLRTEPESYFRIVDECLCLGGVPDTVTASDLMEYQFHRCDDNTVRAANFIITGDSASALELLQKESFPFRTFLVSFRRRKIRVLLMRAVLLIGLRLGTLRSLAKVFVWTEYGGHVQS